MSRRSAALLFLGIGFGLTLPASAQHCGGPCEVPRPAGPVISLNPRFSLTPGEEKANWKYLDNYHWTVDGEPKANLFETLSSPMATFASRRIFVSPAGNGFLVSGNPYSKEFRRGIGGEAAAQTRLFVFCDDRVTLREGLSREEIQLGPCPSNCGCEDILYSFEADPQLTKNGFYVRLLAAKTKRPVTYCLPLGMLIQDVSAFEERLSELEWQRIPEDHHADKHEEIAMLIDVLDSNDFIVRTTAEESLLKLGFLALPAIREALRNETTLEENWRLKQMEPLLKPWAGEGYEAMGVDLDLLGGLVDYSERPVALAAQAQLKRLIPNVETDDWQQWLQTHRNKLRWNADQRIYEQKP